MATRYCGQVKINITLVPARHMPHGEQYKCTLSNDGKRLGTVYVGAPIYLTKGLDSPEMYDETAGAAISFALDDEIITTTECDFDDSGNFIRRGKKYSKADYARIDAMRK